MPVISRKAARPIIRFIAGLIAGLVWLGTLTAAVSGVISRTHDLEIKKHIFQKNGRPLTPEMAAAPEQLWRWSKDLLVLILDWSWAILVSVALLELLRKFLKDNVLSRPNEKVIKRFLDHFYESTKPPDGQQMTYRITLYKRRRFSWLEFLKCPFTWRNPWGGWLSPFERSGSFRTKSWARWRASLDNPQDNSGFAGKVYASGTALDVQNLPSKSEMLKTSQKWEKKRNEYCDRTNCSRKWLDGRMKLSADLPRSFWGVAIEISASSEPWGVLLIDSCHADLIDLKKIGDESATILKFLKIVLTSHKEQ